MSGIDVVFEDEYLLVVNKPGGVGTQAPRQFDSLEARVRVYLEQHQERPEPPYLGIPHRLDRCASGVIVFAKRKRAAQRLSRQFEYREVQKTYLAMVRGCPELAEGTWRDTMRKIPDEPRAELVSADHADAKSAVLHYRVVAKQSTTSRLSIELETGRMHQIRLQCSVRGHPILGDRMYGSDVTFGPDVQHERERTIALHASRMELEHPKTRERVVFTAQPPASWDDV